MIFDLKFDREQIKKALEIVDSTFRLHLANIKRKQALMRRAKAEKEIASEQQRQASTFVPENPLEPGPEVETKAQPTFERKNGKLVRIVPPSSDAPIEHPVSLPPAVITKQLPFVEVHSKDSPKAPPLTRSLFPVKK